jgi:hypothetical protein
VQYTMTGDLVESLEFLGMKVTKAWEYNIQQSVTQLWEEGTKKRNPDMFFDAILLFTLSAIVPHVKVRADDPAHLLRLVRRARSRTFATPTRAHPLNRRRWWVFAACAEHGSLVHAEHSSFNVRARHSVLGP